MEERAVPVGTKSPECYKKKCFQRMSLATTSRRASGRVCSAKSRAVCLVCPGRQDEYQGTVESVWSAWVSVFGRLWPFPRVVKDYFLSWTEEPRGKEAQKQRLRYFCAIIWHIWLERNRRIFQNQTKGVEDIIHTTMLSYNEWSDTQS
ncbi:hypothetical protein AHAS_Ahas03G0158100 [Arachis hypogaea]